jgi:hypothetical protein
MKKLIGMTIGSLFFVTNANAVEFAADARSGINSTGVDLVLELSGIDYSYPETVLRNYKIDGDTGGNSDAGPGFGYDSGDSTFVGWSEYPGGYRLTAGILENYPKANLAPGSQKGITLDAESAKSDITLGGQNPEVSIDKSVPFSNGEQSADRNGRLKLAVGVGMTSLEPDIDIDAELHAGGFNGMDHAELATLLNEAETETSIDLEDYFIRPLLAIGVNYTF